MPSRRNTVLVALALATATATACGPAAHTAVSEEAVPAPLPAEEVFVDPPVGEQPGEGEAQPVEARDDIEHPVPTAWEKVSYRRDTGELTVSWWSGVEPCTALAGVEVAIGEDEVVVTVLEGAPPEAATTSCIAMAQHKQHTVVLDEDPGERRFVDGASA